jgi:hypothetical protein
MAVPTTEATSTRLTAERLITGALPDETGDVFMSPPFSANLYF